MALTLDSIDLADNPDLGGEQLEWIDEWDWDPVEQAQDRSLTGAMIVQEGRSKLYGRPITLSSNGGAYFTLAKVRELEALAEVRVIVMLLTLPTGAQHYVTWNRAAGPSVQAKPMWRGVNPGPNAAHELTLRLITVAPPLVPEVTP